MKTVRTLYDSLPAHLGVNKPVPMRSPNGIFIDAEMPRGRLLAFIAHLEFNGWTVKRWAGDRQIANHPDGSEILIDAAGPSVIYIKLYAGGR